MKDLKDLVGMTVSSYVGGSVGSDFLTLITDEGRSFTLYHEPDCCESCTIHDVVGDLSDLVGEPLQMAEETIREATDEEAGESGTWTFYRFATVRGYVTVSWLGTSNGYYSESVYFREDPRLPPTVWERL